MCGREDAHILSCIHIQTHTHTYVLAVDAGSAGSSTLPGLRKYIANAAVTRVLAFVNIAMEGLAWAGMAGSGKGGELDNLNQVREEPCLAAIEANRDMVVGVKIRLTANIAADGKNEARLQDVPLHKHTLIHPSTRTPTRAHTHTRNHKHLQPPRRLRLAWPSGWQRRQAFL